MRYIRLATAFLVFASLAFYSYWDIRYLPILLISILFNYIIGSRLEKTRSKSLLILGVGTDLFLLGYFKYANFFLDSLDALFHTSWFMPEITLPLGISFFTFTQIAYLVDVYRGETEKYSLLTYSLFVTFFPHLIAGPILYHKDIIPQFSRLRNFIFSHKNMALGLTMFSMGLFKKVIIADKLAPWVNIVFNHADKVTFIEAWAGALSYTLQLYFDFSGYSEMAIGLGLMLNIRLPINFNSPYKAKSIIEFWRRWHITLSEFLKSYLYIPLGGNRFGNLKKMRNILITMILGGLWHGAGWTYIIWGALHGVYLVINHSWRKLSVEIPKLFSWLLTFISVVIAWVYFRAMTIHDATNILKTMFGLKGIVLPYSYAIKFPVLEKLNVPFRDLSYIPEGIKELGIIAFLIFWVFFLPNTNQIIKKYKPTWYWAIAIVIVIITSLICLNQVSEFLYFQF